MVQYAQNLNGVQSDSINDDKRGSRNYQFPRPAQPAASAKIRVIQQVFNGLPDPSGRLTGRLGIVLGDKIASIGQVLDGAVGPVKLHASPTAAEP